MSFLWVDIRLGSFSMTVFDKSTHLRATSSFALSLLARRSLVLTVQFQRTLFVHILSFSHEHLRKKLSILSCAESSDCSISDDWWIFLGEINIFQIQLFRQANLEPSQSNKSNKYTLTTNTKYGWTVFRTLKISFQCVNRWNTIRKSKCSMK